MEVLGRLGSRHRTVMKVGKMRLRCTKKAWTGVKKYGIIIGRIRAHAQAKEKILWKQ